VSIQTPHGHPRRRGVGAERPNERQETIGMKPLGHKLIGWTFAVCAVLMVHHVPALAETTEAADVAEQAAPSGATPQAAKPRSTANWWEKSSIDFLDVRKTLTHATGSFSFMDATGNTRGRTYDVEGGFDAQRWRVTSEFYFEMSRKKIVYGMGGGSADYHEHTVREQLNLDLTRRLWLLGGVEHYTNTLYFMNRRLNKYGGVGADVYDSDRHHFHVIVALGHADYIFDESEMLTLSPQITANVKALPTMRPSSGGYLGMQSWHWSITHNLAFDEDATYMDYFQSILGHRWTLNLSGDIAVTKNFSVGPAYRIKKEVNDYVRALTIQPMDRMFLFGFRVSI
jgi:hypothetical protein